MKAGTRVRTLTPSLGTVRLYSMTTFTDVIVGEGAEGTIVDAERLPDGWVLVKLDQPDPEPDHVYSDGHLYLPVHPEMIEAVA